MSLDKPSEETLRKMLEIQWQDHFQTRMQTWKALEITALLAVAVVGIDWRTGDHFVTAVASLLLILVAQFGIMITLKHRKVERTKFELISSFEKQLGVAIESLNIPEELSWFSIFDFRKSNTPLFIMRALFIIQMFAVGYGFLHLISK